MPAACCTLTGMDVRIRHAHPHEYDRIGEITAQAYLGDGLLDFGESDEYLGELRRRRERATAAEVLVAVDHDHVLGAVTLVCRAAAPWPT